MLRAMGLCALCLVVIAPVCASAAESDARSVVLLEDEFGKLRPGVLGSILGARAEYHYLPETARKGNWGISTYLSGPSSQRGWKVARHQGEPVMLQTYENKHAHTHPMLVAGDQFWTDYTVKVRFTPQSERGQTGIVFRYRNDRCYYFFGVSGSKAVLKMVRQEAEFHKPFEKVLASREFSWKPNTELSAEVSVTGRKITATFGDTLKLEAEDDTYPAGKIALTSDTSARFAGVRVTASEAEQKRSAAAREKFDREQRELQDANPKPVVWKKISTDGFGVGRNLRFGDLDGDGQIDVLVGQMLHHGPKDTNSEVSCLTAMTFDGKKLWQIGEPDPWKDFLTNDVAFQIHDLDGDGKNEVVYCKGMEIIVAEGATGKTKYKAPTPETPKDTKVPFNKFPRILGDSMMFCDLRGLGRAGDIILKDRYRSVWALNEKLEPLWHLQCNTGHYPFSYDVDGDGKDELAIGYSLVDDNGKVLWTLDDKISDHADGIAIVKLSEEKGAELRLVCAASDEGFFITDVKGKVLTHQFLGHVQNPATADFRPDLPGLETVSVNFWGNQGIIYYFDAEGKLYHDFEPFDHGSMCLPVNWTGKPGEFVVLSPNVDDGGMFDGWGRRAVAFPGDGHPDMCYAVLDVTGDCRDEVVVWDPYELWVYTQSDSPLKGKLYKPKRNPLYNYSNYQATVSLPGWSE